MWNEARRVVRPGGVLRVRGIVANHLIEEISDPAPAWVHRLSAFPTLGEVVSGAREAGFVNIQVVKFDSSPAWATNDLELYEFEILGNTPSAGQTLADREVLYRGPFMNAVADNGQVFPRGERIRINERTWNDLRRGPYAEQFLFAIKDASATCGGDQCDIRQS
jgi:hypothetical protein